MTPPTTNTDGLWQKDEIDILRKVRRALCDGYYTTAEEKAALRSKLCQGAQRAADAQKDYVLIQYGQTLAKLEEIDLRRLEVLDKISRLDNGQATERTESFTVVITEARDEPRADDPPDPVPQTD